MSSEEEALPPRKLFIPVQPNGTYITGPVKIPGPGTLVYFNGGGKKLENVAFRHHMHLGEDYLAINGCVMAVWDESGDGVTCCVRAKALDDMDESSD